MGTKVLKARWVDGRESGFAWMQVEFKDDALDALIRVQHFEKTERAPSELTAGVAGAPEWWRLSPDGKFEYYINSNWVTPGWKYGRAAMAVDRAHGMVFFHSYRGD